jgi:hypothetical protein
MLGSSRGISYMSWLDLDGRGTVIYTTLRCLPVVEAMSYMAYWFTVKLEKL